MRMDNLKMIWHNQLTGDFFPKLKSLDVLLCKKLLTVFPSDMCGSLWSLESLDVSHCDSLENLFDLQGINSEERHSVAASQLKEECIDDPHIMLSFANLGKLKVSDCQSIKNLFSSSIVAKEARARFLFPKLTSLELYRLPELRTFNAGRHTVEVPILKRLELCHCRQMQKTLFLFPQAFPCLEELKLAGKFESSFEEIFTYEGVRTQARTSTKLKRLSVDGHVDLKYIWKQNSKLDLILQNLDVLRVQNCDSLINLLPPSAAFQNLTVLEAMGCDSLINMGTSSTARSLVQLTKMSISFSKKITEVIGNHGDVTEDEIIFSKLKSLTLQGLPSLTSFCSWNFSLKFPSLEELTVEKCPKMKFFSQGDLAMQKLRKVQIDGNSVKLPPDFDLNTALQQFLIEEADAQSFTEYRYGSSSDGWDW